MKTIGFCAIIIAISTFTMAVEDVYGWSKVRPHAEAAWSYAYDLGAELAGFEARAEAVVEARQDSGSGSISVEAGE
ncbi:MAG: hypothetical protein ACTSQ7_10485 [Alphaproteobacteria bacterium]